MVSSHSYVLLQYLGVIWKHLVSQVKIWHHGMLAMLTPWRNWKKDTGLWMVTEPGKCLIDPCLSVGYMNLFWYSTHCPFLFQLWSVDSNHSSMPFSFLFSFLNTTAHPPTSCWHPNSSSVAEGWHGFQLHTSGFEPVLAGYWFFSISTGSDIRILEIFAYTQGIKYKDF